MMKETHIRQRQGHDEEGDSEKDKEDGVDEDEARKLDHDSCVKRNVGGVST